MRDQPARHALDPRAPLVLDTRDLPRRPGALRRVQRGVPAPAEFGLELIRVPAGARIDLELRLESVSEGVLVSGSAQVEVTGECGRCLRALRRAVTVAVRELYAYQHSTTDTTAEADEVGRVYDGLIDLEPQLRDAIVLSLPPHPLCRPDCPGLCTGCGVPWDELPAGHGHEQIDARWAALGRLRDQLQDAPGVTPPVRERVARGPDPEET